MSQWSYNTPVAQAGATVIASGGGTVPFRDSLDAARTPMGQYIPSAQWPDGYLGTIQSRREDRLLDKVKQRLNDRPYQRGVHKGEKIDPSDYFWPDEMNDQSGILYESRGLKWTAPGTITERLAHGGKNAITSPEDMAAARSAYGIPDDPAPQQIDPIRRQRMSAMLPSWR